MRSRPFAVVMIFAAVARAADPLPSVGDLQALADAGQWPKLLSATSRVLTLRGPAAKAYDRAAVWTMKAEAQVQSDQPDAAAASLTKAAAEPGVSPEQADAAIAHAELFKESDAKGYKTPAGLGEAKAFDVKNPAKRPEALAALLSVNAAELTAAIDAAKAVASPRPLVELAERTGRLAHLDRVVNKSASTSDALQKRLAQNVVAAAKTWAAKADERLAKMAQRADEEVDQRQRDAAGRLILRKVRRGYQPADMKEAVDLARQGQTWADTVQAIRTPLNAAGRGELAAAEGVIQGTYDKAKAVQSATLRPRS